ncbi:excitatory amino acid transporter 3 [Biomphalaria pfeifferi]|uniref:Amino acid transporter n=1 Tax=Biomphalaria pfeifferi TaxID=112525 RepID=A0AAD8AQW0_BIOPF|nr:excitatory amino acid transporter 3 [Biomphalaria pfeifferi]
MEKINSDHTTDYGTLDDNNMELGTAKGSPPAEEDHCSDKSKTTLKEKCLRLARANLLVLLLILALIVGVALGAGLRSLDPPMSKRQQMYLKFPGEILMNMLQLLILPLIVSSLITGLTSLDAGSSGKLGARAILYYITTTLLAVILGIVLVLSIKPGERGDKPVKGSSSVDKVEPADTFLDLIRQMFPDNIIEATFSKKLTKLQMVVTNISAAKLNDSLANNKTIEPEYRPVLVQQNGINMLGLVVFSVAMGIAINRIGPKGKPLKEVIEAICEATLQLVTAVIWYSPVGVVFLVASQIVSMDDPMKSFEQLGFYFVTVMSGLAIHGLIVLPFIYFIFVRKNPYKFMLGVLQAMLTALGTSSSSATLPVTMRNLEENNGIDPRVIAFVAPVGATINMDGTALYEAVAVIFIGQVRGITLGIGEVVVVCLTATAAAIGAAGVPQAGLVTMVIVLTAVGFPTDDVGMIIAIDWLLDRFRTMINVLGDTFGAGIVDRYSKADLRRMDEEKQKLAMVSEGVDKIEQRLLPNKHSNTNGESTRQSGLDNPAYETAKL